MGKIGYAGRIVELSTAEELFGNLRHPYTRALLSAVPNPDPDTGMEFGMPGEAADPGNLPRGCSFHPRCPNRFDPCDKRTPPLQAVQDNGLVACRLYGDRT